MPKKVDERAASYEVPTILSNRFYVDTAGGHTRIAFAEYPAGFDTPQYRTAVLLSNENAFQLAELIRNTLKLKQDDGPHAEKPA